LDFDGVEDYVAVPAFNLTTDTVTFVAWINGWKAGDWAGIVFSRSDHTCGMDFGSNDTLHYTWNNNSASTYGWEGGPVIPQNQWAMLALAIEPDKATAYVYSEAGGLQQGVNNIGHVAQTIDDLKIGWDDHADSRRFQGLIDDVRIYSRALDETEILNIALASEADPNFVWERAAYWDARYPSCFTDGVLVRDGLEYAGYEILDADQLKTWMDARITDRAPSVVVFCQDIAPDTVAESMSPACTLRQYLDVGGKIIWYADTPFWQQGHADGTTTVWDRFGSINILGFYAADGPSDSYDEVTLTAEGVQWGLTEGWQSIRPVSADGVRVLAVDDSSYAAAWVKHYVLGDTYRGFVRLFDRDGDPNIDDVRCVAEYPHVPE
jgi:hypothetical protein